MICTVCHHRPSGRPGDEGLYELGYMDGVIKRADNLCRACAFMASNAAGVEIMRLKKKFEDSRCKTA